MNDHTEPKPRRSNGPTREDILIGRITDGEASPNDWAEIEALAEADAGVWHRLAESQRTHARVESAVEDAIAIAELIDIPDLRTVGRPVLATIRESAGWLMAAGLAVALTISMVNQNTSRPSDGTPIAQNPVDSPRTLDLPSADRSDLGSQTLQVGNTYTPEEGYDRYLMDGYRKGYVVGERAPSMLEANRLPDGTFEILITRSHIERRNVTDLNSYRVLKDEWGNEHLVPTGDTPEQIQVRQIY